MEEKNPQTEEDADGNTFCTSLETLWGERVIEVEVLSLALFSE